MHYFQINTFLKIVFGTYSYSTHCTINCWTFISFAGSNSVECVNRKQNQSSFFFQSINYMVNTKSIELTFSIMKYLSIKYHFFYFRHDHLYCFKCIYQIDKNLFSVELENSVPNYSFLLLRLLFEARGFFPIIEI